MLILCHLINLYCAFIILLQFMWLKILNKRQLEIILELN
jgi:hypothetical protein